MYDSYTVTTVSVPLFICIPLGLIPNLPSLCKINSFNFTLKYTMNIKDIISTSKTQVDAFDSMLSPKPILVNNRSHIRN